MPSIHWQIDGRKSRSIDRNGPPVSAVVTGPSTRKACLSHLRHIALNWFLIETVLEREDYKIIVSSFFHVRIRSHLVQFEHSLSPSAAPTVTTRNWLVSFTSIEKEKKMKHKKRKKKKRRFSFEWRQNLAQKNNNKKIQMFCVWKEAELSHPLIIFVLDCLYVLAILVFL